MDRRMKRVGLLLLYACVMTLPPLMTIAAASPGDGPFVVLHAPWVDGGAAVVAAGGRPIGLSDTSVTTLAAAPDPETFRALLQRGGIGLVIAADRLPFLCADADPTPATGQAPGASTSLQPDPRP
jgi:hypothetical protein